MRDNLKKSGEQKQQQKKQKKRKLSDALRKNLLRRKSAEGKVEDKK